MVMKCVMSEFGGLTSWLLGVFCVCMFVCLFILFVCVLYVCVIHLSYTCVLYTYVIHVCYTRMLYMCVKDLHMCYTILYMRVNMCVIDLAVIQLFFPYAPKI